MGLNHDGTPGPNFTAGVEIHAPVTVLAAACRGSISKQLIKKFALDSGHCPQTFALGYKELWQLPAGRVRPGRIEHALGWPADSHTYAGSFLYHLDNDRVYVGYIVGLDYEDPRLQPCEAFQQYKNHPSVKALLEGGEIVSAGARTIAAGGWQSAPTLEMPGAMLVGEAGGGRGRDSEFRQDQGRAPGDPLRNAGGRATRGKRRQPRLRRPLARFPRR